MKYLLVGLILLTLIGVVVLQEALAYKTQPISAEFGFGARVDLSGQYVKPSINAAAGLNMDWVALEIDWAAWMPDEAYMPDMSALDAAMRAARQSNLRVMLSLAHAPDWASTPRGPDPGMTARLLISLVNLYGDILKAVELYPAANTLEGWGAPPNPAAYAELAQQVDAILKAKGFSLILVTSLTPARQSGDMNDRDYLDALYEFGAVDWMPVVGVRLPSLEGDPKADPSSKKGNVLRHYEILRQVMLQHKHTQGVIWITSFSFPADPVYASPQGQAQWVDQAYKLLRAQLYIGVAFFQQLNPPAAGMNPTTQFYVSLILPDGTLHPACKPISRLTSLEPNVQKVYFQDPVTKKMPLKAIIKP